MDAQVRIQLLTVRSIRKIYNSNILSDELLELILKSFKTFKGFLNNVTLSDDDTSLLVHLVAKAVKCTRQTKRETVHRLLQKFCDSKLFKEKGTRLLVGVTCSNQDIHGMPCLLSDFLTILTQLMQRMPTSCTTPQIIGFVDLLEMQLSECDRSEDKSDKLNIVTQLKSEICTVIEQRNTSDSNRKKNIKPQNDFRTMSVVPIKDDVIFPVLSLRCNKVIGPYLDLDDYLDVQFRLYREDCISPLRDALAEAVEKQRSNQKNFRLEDGLIYRKISIEGKEMSLDFGEIFTIKLDKEHYKRIKWDKSSRLIFGSLLLLSFDSFNTIFFAVVADSDRESLKEKGSFKVQIFKSGNKSDLRVPWRTHGMMLESTSAYFESYKHVLKALQNISPSYPFQKYLVYCESKVDPPNYIGKETVYDLGPIITGARINLLGNALGPTQTEPKEEHFIRISQHKEEWPTAEELKMDESQRQAFIAALTKEFVLIQGPPGTGKTHLGLQIAKALLHNSIRWNTNEVDEPTELSNSQDKSSNDTIPQLPVMLVVCYTNHALDQFVEGIVDFIPRESRRVYFPKVVRFGSRCKNLKVAEFSIQNAKKRIRYNFPNHRHGVLDRAMDMKKQMKAAKEMLEIIKRKSIVLNYTAMKCVMSDDHSNSFGDENRNLAWFQWLHITQEAWAKDVFKHYQNIHEELTDQSKVSESNYNQEVLVNIISEADYAYNERYFDIDDMEQQIQINDIGLDVNRLLHSIYESEPLLDDMCCKIYETVKEKIERQIQVKGCLPEVVAEEIPNLWKLDIKDRWELYRYWLKKLEALQRQELKQSEKTFNEIFDEYSRASKEMDEEIMRNAVVIAMTTTAAARYNESLNKVCPKVTIVEEAAEVPEAHIVSAINHKCQHLILIGDHKQLEPKPAVYKLARNYNLSVSLFERMVENKLSCQCLQRQHRMRPEISTLVRHIYNVLEDNDNVFTYEPIKGIKKNIFFITHDKEERFSTEGRSYSNDYEAEYLKELCQYLLKQGYNGSDITIIAAYSGQMYRIREKMPRALFGEVNICVLDNYQGEENEIILLSLVRSNTNGDIGFLKRENRICVALSRAKKGLYIIGNRSTLISNSEHWQKIFQNIEEMDEQYESIDRNGDDILSSYGKGLPLYCQNHPMNKGIVATLPADFKKVPDGGCDMKCDFLLDCGHSCQLRCHPVDKEHKLYKCKAICEKQCLEGHTCRKKCHYDKDCHCSEMVDRILQCHHVAKLKCHEKFLEHMCTVQVSRTLSCGHEATMACHTNPNTCRCQILVDKSLACGHSAMIQCYKDSKNHKCESLITEKRSVCGHDLTRKCYDVNYERKHQCNEIVVERRKTCDHQFERKCYDTNFENHQNCEVLITEIRSLCGHQYERPCFDTAYVSNHLCEEIIEEHWSSCKHAYDRQCFDEHFSERENCKVKVERVFETCGHKLRLPCHLDISSQVCKEIVITELDCGHTKRHPCNKRDNLVCHSKCNKTCINGHDCDKTCHFPNQCNCKTLIDVVLEKCTHKQQIPCSSDLLDYKCKAVVSKIMPSCGHMQSMKCSENPELMNCYVSVLKQFECGHKNEVACFSDITYINCAKHVEITLKSCGHKAEVECWQKESANVKCREPVPFKRPQCGHVIDIDCCTRNTDKILPPCNGKVEISLPCGHNASRSCSKANIKTECKNTCGKKLSCGHQCLNKCKTCQSSQEHGKCRTSCGKQLLCGHHCKSKKCMECTICDDVCSFSCPHSKCDLKCIDQCKECTKKCAWQCPHFQCKKTCSEICTRPRCILQCKNALICGHQCTGFCGEPCPALCMKCKPDIYNFQKLSKDTRTVTLTSCGHTFESRFIDDHIKQRKNDIILKCPVCKTTITHHPRYNVILKRNKALLENAKQQIRENRTKPGIIYPAVNMNFIPDVQGYVRSFATFLHITQQVTKSRELLNIAPVGRDLILNINKRIQNSDQRTFHGSLSIFEKVQRIFLLWIECLLFCKPSTLSKSYTVPYNHYYPLGLINYKRLQHNQDEKTICLTGAEIITRLQKAVTEGKDHEIMLIIEPLTGDCGRNPHFQNAIRYPQLSPVVGIHQDEWSVCKKGHISPCLVDVTCFICDGTQTTAFGEMFLKTPVATYQAQANGSTKTRERKEKWGNSNGETTRPSQSKNKDKTVPFSKRKQPNQATNKVEGKERTESIKQTRKEQSSAKGLGDEKIKEQHWKGHPETFNDNTDQGRRGNRGRVRQFHGLRMGRGRGKRC